MNIYSLPRKYVKQDIPKERIKYNQKNTRKKAQETIRCSRDTMNIVGCMLRNEDIEGIRVVVGFAVKNIGFYIHDLIKRMELKLLYV